jgi:hypothetical protein
MRMVQATAPPCCVYTMVYTNNPPHTYGTYVVEVKDAERSQQCSDRSGIRSPPFWPTSAQRRERCQLSPWLLNARRVLR